LCIAIIAFLIPLLAFNKIFSGHPIATNGYPAINTASVIIGAVAIIAFFDSVLHNPVAATGAHAVVGTSIAGDFVTIITLLSRPRYPITATSRYAVI
jgi:hypothetical protein